LIFLCHNFSAFTGLLSPLLIFRSERVFHFWGIDAPPLRVLRESPIFNKRSTAKTFIKNACLSRLSAKSRRRKEISALAASVIRDTCWLAAYPQVAI